MWEMDPSDSLLVPTDLALDKLSLKVGFFFVFCIYCFSVIQKDDSLIGTSEVLAIFFKPLLILTRCIMAYEIVHCHGMTESVKVLRKDQSVEDFSSKCLFLLFWTISCVSLISLIEI